MDSNEQLETDSNTEQPKEVTGGQANEQPQSFDINGETVDIEELKKGYLRQSDYTKKTQELSNLKKETELTEDERGAIDFLKTNGFLSKEDLERAINTQKNESNLSSIIHDNPDLKPFEAAIKELSVEKGIAPEDVIEKYGFKSKNKLQKAKLQGDVKGALNTPTGKKSISEMSDKEYAVYKSKVGIGTGGTFS